METVSNNPINISKEGPGYIQKELEDKMKDIIFQVKSKLDIEFTDDTYRQLYIMTVQFAKQVSDMLQSGIEQPDNVFNAAPDINSFKNQKLV